MQFRQKQPLRGVPWERCSENMQQICRITPISKCDFNKVALQFYCMGVVLYICCIFSEHLFLKTPLDGYFYIDVLSDLAKITAKFMWTAASGTSENRPCLAGCELTVYLFCRTDRIWLFVCCKTKLKKNTFFWKNICFLQNIHYLQKKMFLYGKKVL